MVFENIEWQISSTVASCLTVLAILSLFIRFKDERKSNVSSLILGILDVGIGILSIALISYTTQAIVVAISSAKTLKLSKVSIQSEKAMQLLTMGKPVIVKIIIKVFPLVGAFIVNKLLKKGNENMETDEKNTSTNKFKDLLSRFVAFMKRNVKTNIATVANAVASIGSGFAVGGGMYVGDVNVPYYVNIIVGVIITIAMFILVETGVVAKGLESQEEYDARIAQQKAEAEAKAAAEQEAKEIAAAKAKAAAEKQKMIEILEQEEAKELAIAEEAQAKIKAEQIKQEYKKAVANGEFQGTLVEYINQK